MTVHRVHGIVVRFAAAVPGAAVGDGQIDFVVDELTEPFGGGAPAAALGRSYSAELEGDRLWVRFHGTAEFLIDPAARRIGVRALPGADPGVVDVLLTGNVLALALGLRGAAVLHASTVALGGRQVAFAGVAGAGKSTCAGLACLAGGRLFGDDALRLDGTTGHRGVAELRFRAGAERLARALGPVRRTGDGRWAVAPSPADVATAPVGLVVFPRWIRGGTEVAATPLRATEAVAQLLGSPRVTGWSLDGPVRANFAAATALARSVPAVEVRLPYGAELDAELAKRLVTVLP